jgi:hypothetical protein
MQRSITWKTRKPVRPDAPVTSTCFGTPTSIVGKVHLDLAGSLRFNANRGWKDKELKAWLPAIPRSSTSTSARALIPTMLIAQVDLRTLWLFSRVMDKIFKDCVKGRFQNWRMTYKARKA